MNTKCAFDVGPFIINYSFEYTNKLQRDTILFITVNAVHVTGGFSAHHQELKNCTHTASGICQASGSSKQAWHIPDAICTVFELLMMGGETV
jgi:hypothetical protein